MSARVRSLFANAVRFVEAGHAALGHEGHLFLDGLDALAIPPAIRRLASPLHEGGEGEEQGSGRRRAVRALRVAVISLERLGVVARLKATCSTLP